MCSGLLFFNPLFPTLFIVFGPLSIDHGGFPKINHTFKSIAKSPDSALNFVRNQKQIMHIQMWEVDGRRDIKVCL